MTTEVVEVLVVMWAVLTVGFMSYAYYVWYGMDGWHKPVKARMRWLATGSWHR